MSKLTQKERVLRHLKMVGAIDPFIAQKEYGIMRLASRIGDLKKDGVSITTSIKRHTNRFGEHTHYASYSLKE